MIAQHCECTGSHVTAYFDVVKMADFMFCDLYLNKKK